MIRFVRGLVVLRSRLSLAALLGLSACFYNLDAGAQTAPDPGGNKTATQLDASPLSITEDSASPTDFRVSGINLSDAEGTPTQIRLTAVSGGTVTRSGGMSITIGEAGVGDALTLTGTMIDLEFVPSANRDTNATITYKVVDPAADPDSSASTITITIAAVNDAPSVSAGTLAAVAEDATDPAGATVTSLFGGSYVDPDTNPATPLEGIAITGGTDVPAQGVWEYDPEGDDHWFPILPATLSVSVALYVEAAGKIRFVPTANYDGSVSPLTIRALDSTNAQTFSSTTGMTETRQTHNASTNGNATPISGTAVNLNTSITPSNDAPSVGNGTLAAVNEDTANPPGATITTLFGGSFSDPDTSPAASLSGVAVVGDPVAAAQGQWQYSPDAGVNWFPVSDGAPVLSTTSALYLSAATRVRFVPASNFSGAASGLTIRALDNTNALAFSSNAGAVETREINNVSTNGGGTAISGTTAALNTSITAVNDAPTIGNGTLAAVNEDTANPPGATITSLFGGGFVDPDSTLAGIAVVSDPANAGQGAWQFSPDSVNWFNITSGLPVPSTTNALYLSAATRIRFLPASNYASTVSGLTVRAIDSSNALAFSTNAGAVVTRQVHDVTTNGSPTPIGAATATLNTSLTAINDDPVFLQFPGSTQTVNEDTNLVFTTANSNRIQLDDIDIGGSDIRATLAVSSGTLTLSGTAGLSAVSGNGTTSVSLDGSLSEVNAAIDGLIYRGTSQFNGGDTLGVTINDLGNTGSGGGGNVVMSVGITVSAVNDDPTFTSFPGVSQVVSEDTNLTFNSGNGNLIAINDIDLGSNDIRVALSVSNGTLTLGSTVGLSSATGNGTGSVTIEGPLAPVNTALNNLVYRGTQDFFGADTLMVAINDLGSTGSGGGGDVTMSVGITVNAVNDTPTQVQNNTLTLNQGAGSVISSALLAYTDVDDVNNTLVYTVVTPPANGTINLGASFTQGNINASAVTYTHDNSATTSDSFVFNVRDDDNATTSNATFNITINRRPTVVTPIADVSVNESANNTTNTVFSVSSNFADPELGALTFTVTTVSGNAIFRATPSFAGATLTLPYAMTSPGVANVTVRATDPAGAFVEDTFTVSVNDAPVAINDPGFNTDEGSAIIIDVLANDTDLTATGAAGTLDPATVMVTSGPSNGMTSVNVANGRITYTPTGDFNGSDSFTYTVRDTNATPATSNTATVSVTVNPVNDGPGLNAPAATQNVAEGGVLTFSVANGNAVSVTDVDADETALPGGGVNLTLQATKGTVTLASTTGLANLTGNGTASVSFDGAVSSANDVNDALNGFTYTPNALENGAATILVTVSDKGNTGSGGILAANDTIDVNIAATNDPPVVTVPGAQTVNEDVATGIAGISVADPDAGGGNLVVTLGVAQGQLSVNASALGGVPSGNITGNGTASVSLTGTLTQLNNTLPTLTFRTATNITTTQVLTVAANDNGNTGGPAETDSETVLITITPQNDNPTFSNFPGVTQAVNEDTTLQFSTANGNRITIADVDAGAGEISASLSVLNGTLTPNGTAGLSVAAGYGTSTVSLQGTLSNVNTALNGLSYLASLNYNGADTLTVVINDLGNTGAGGGTNVMAAVGINVAARNDGPMITVPGAQTVDEDTNFAFSSTDGNAIAVTDVDADEAPGDLIVTLAVANGTLTLADISGLTSSSGNMTASVSLTGSVSAIDAALDGLVYRGNNNFNGSDTLNVTANDQGNTGGGGTGMDADSVSITVDAVNNAPTLTLPGTQTINEDATSLVTGISVADIDAGSANLIVSLSVLSGRLRVSDTVPGGVPALAIGNNNTSAVTLTGSLSALNVTLPTLTFTSALNNRNNQTLTVVVDDQGNTGSGGNQTDSGTVALNITALNDNPILSLPGAQGIDEDNSLIFATGNGNALSVSDVDVAEAPGQLRLTLSVAHGRITLGTTAGITLVTGTGSSDATVTFTGTATAINTALDGLTYVPDTDFNTGAGQTEALSVIINDQGNTGLGGGSNITGSVTINVAGVNDDPVATVPGAQVVDEDTDLTFAGTISISDLDLAETVSGTLQVTLSAAEGTLTLSTTSGLVLAGTATGTNDAAVTFTGSESAVNAALNGLRYRGNLNFNGADMITVVVNDLGNTGQGGGGNVTRTVSITVTPVNDAPVASNLVLSPAEPLRNEDLIATYDYADVDLDPESGTTIRWFRDGVLQSAFNNLSTVPMSATVEEEVWFFRVVPGDGLVAGAEVQSNSVSIRPVANLQMSIAREPAQVVPGESVTYTFQVRNLGPSPVNGAAVVSVIPAELQGATWTCAACGSSGTGSINESVDLAAGATVVYSLTALVDAAATGDLVVSGSVQGSALVFELDAADNTDSDTVPVVPEATLSVTMSADLTTAQPGDTVVYTVSATNNGPSDARGVLFSDTPDLNTALVVGSVTASQGTINTGNGVGDLSVAVDVGTLPLGATVAITYAATIAAPFPADGMRMVCTRGRFFGEESNPEVNFVEAQPPADICTTVESTISLSATKIDALLVDLNANGVINPGDTIRYTVSMTNSGDGGASNVRYTSPAIENGVLVEDSITTNPSALAITPANGGFTATLARLEGLNPESGTGNSATITFDVIIRNPIPPGEAFLACQGSIRYDELPSEADPVLTDDPDAVVIEGSDVIMVDGDGNIVRPAPTVTQITAAPILIVRKEDDIDRNEEKRPGDRIDYVVTIENRGNKGATNLIYRTSFRDNEITQAELEQVDGGSTLIDIVTSLLTNFEALDVDGSAGLSTQELDGSFFALTPVQFSELDRSDARLHLIEDSITVDGAPVANDGSAADLVLILDDLNGRNPLFTSGPSVTIGFSTQLEPVLAQGVTLIQCQGTLSSDELTPVVSDDPETVNVANDRTQTAVRATPELTIVPEILTIDFGDQDIDDGPTLSRIVELTNAASATANLTFSFVGLEGVSLSEFEILNDSDQDVLQPGQTRLVELVFDPDSIGNKRASLRVESDDPDDSAVDINLSGRALDSDIRVTPSSLDFDKRNLLAGPSNPQSVSIINDGLGVLTLDSVTLSCGPDVLPVMTLARFDALDRNGDGVLTQGIGVRRELELAVDLFDIAELLIESFGDLDVDHTLALTAAEVDARFPFVTDDRFSALDVDASLDLTAAELEDALRLAEFSETLLGSFSDFDISPPAGLDFSEAQSILPDLTEAEFQRIDGDADNVLLTAELDERVRLALIAEQLQTDFFGLDADRDSILTMDEINTFIPLLTPGRFSVLDSDESDELSEAELESSESVLAASILADFVALDTDSSGGVTIDEINATCSFEILSDSGEDALETAQSRLVRIVFNPSTEGIKVGTLRIEANQSGQGTPIVSKVSLFGIGNRTPRITGQNPVTTAEDTPVTIILDNLIVDSPLLDFPGEVTLAFQPIPAGANFTRDGNAIVPRRDFNGVLLVPVTVRDGNIDSNIWNLRIDVTRVNDAPTNITLAGDSIAENQVLDTVIGTFNTTDPDIGDLHLYSLVPDDPTTDDDDFINNELFGIVANQLVSRVVFDFETEETYTILVRSRDPEGLTIERAFSINVLDQPNDEDNSVSSEVLLNNFEDADSNGDGIVTFEESLGLLPGFTQERFDTLNTETELSRDELERAVRLTGDAQRFFDGFDLADSNGNGALSLSEASRFVSGFEEDALVYMDLDGSGTLVPSELQVAILLQGDFNELLRRFSELDADGSGSLTFDELPRNLAALDARRFDALESNPGLSRRELESQVTCMLTEGSVQLIEPSGDLLAPPGASLLEVTFNAEVDVNVEGVCRAEDVEFTFDIGAESILITDLAEYFLLNFVSLDSDFDGVLAEDEIAFSRLGLTPERFAVLDFNGNATLSEEELEAAVILSDLAVALLDNFASLNTDNSTGLSFAETIGAGLDLDTLRYDIIDLNGDDVLTRQELEAEADLPGFLTENFLAADSNADSALTVAEVRVVLPGLSLTRFDNLDADRDGFVTGEELQHANDFQKAHPVFAELLPDKEARKQLRGTDPVIFTLPVNNAYRVRVTATLPETGQTEVSEDFTFEIRNGTDSDDNGYVDFPFEDLVNDGSRWQRTVASVNCNRRVLMHRWQGANIPGRDIEAVLVNPANPVQQFSLVVPHGLAAEGEESVLIAAIACDAESLFTREGAGIIADTPEDMVSGGAWLALEVIVRAAGAPTFAPVSEARLAQRPIRISLSRLTFSPEDDATFFRHATETVSDEATGLDLLPSASEWTTDAVLDPTVSGSTLTAMVRRLGTFVAIESLKPPILITVPDISAGIDAGEVLVNDTVDVAVTVTNIGGERLVGTAELREANGVFLLVGDVSYDLGHGESHQFFVRFSPAAAGDFAATLAFSGDPKGLAVAEVRGTGMAPKAFGCGPGSKSTGSLWGNLLVMLLTVGALAAGRRRQRA